MIFGKWNPIGAFLASLLFGFADSLQVKMQILRVPIPSSFLAMAPYVITMIVLTGIVGGPFHLHRQRGDVQQWFRPELFAIDRRQ
jgi:ABC-type uncharacterized transport system permease subunit